MPNFSVPNQINPGDALDANKAMANWNQVVNDLNGAKIDATNTAVAFAKDNVEPAFAGYKTFIAVGGQLAGAGVAGQYPLSLGGFNLANAQVGGTGSSVTMAGVFQFDPAWVVASTRTTKLRLITAVTPNAVAPATSFTFGLFPVSSTAGGSSGLTTVTVGAQAGTGTTHTTPAASAPNLQTGADFNAPSAGFYVVTVTLAGAMAAATNVNFYTQVQYRQI